MAASRGVQTVDGFGGYPQCRIEPDRTVRQGDVIVDRFGKSDYVQSGAFEPQGILLRPTSAYTNQRVQLMAITGVTMASVMSGFCLRSAYDAACLDWYRGSYPHASECRTAARVKFQCPILHEPPETVEESRYTHSECILCGLTDSPDRGIEAGQFTPACENTDMLRHVLHPCSSRASPVPSGQGRYRPFPL